MVSIYEKQNDPIIIQSLFAQRQYYTYAKICSFIYFVVSIILVVVFAVLKSFYKCEFLTGLSIGLSFATMFAASFADELSSGFKKKAAEIQQFIDTYLFASGEIPLAQWFPPLNKDQIIEEVSSFPDKDFCPNDKWYENYSKKSHVEQILFCQKENIRWDKKLRQRYRIVCNIILIAAIVVIFIIGLLNNPSLLEVLGYISWVIPFIKYCFSFNKKINEDCSRLSEINERADKIIAKSAIKNVNITNDIINLQNSIMEHRKIAILIPNFFFKLFHNNFQRHETSIANRYNEENR